MAGEGSIYRIRNSSGEVRWRAQLSVGSRTDRTYRTRTCLTRADARVALDELRDEQRRRIAPSRQSLGDYLRWWLEESVGDTISPNTRRGYADVIEHLAPIAGIQLRDLTAEDLEGVFNRMTSRRGKVAKPVAPKTVRNVQAMLRRALGMAHERGKLSVNVARQVPLRRVPARDVEAMTPELARSVLAAVAGDRYEAAYTLALIGLRESEILGLGWDDVDFEAATVNLRWQLVGSGATARRTPSLKTSGSKALVPIPPFVVTSLERHRDTQRAERPVASLDGGLVFVTPRGLAVNGSWLTKHFQQLLAAAGLPRLRVHDLRHGAATLLVGAGAHPRVAQELLRHASSRVTMEVYSHVTAGQRREAVDLLERAIGGE